VPQNSQHYSKTQKVAGIIASYFLCALVIWLASAANAESSPLPLEMSFNKPAKDWESESLPIGNGALGANIMGGINLDELQFAEKSLWTGGPKSKQGYDFGLPPDDQEYPKKLAAIQAKIRTESQLSPEDVAKVLGREYSGYGSYQSFASVKMHFFYDINAVSNYQRSLDLTTAISTVRFTENGVNYRREYFVSFPDQVIVTRLSADQKGKINVELSLTTDENRSIKQTVKPGQLRLVGHLNDNNLQYTTITQIHQLNGKQIQHAQSIQINSADEVWFVVAANTNYRQHYPDYQGEDAQLKAERTLSNLANLSYEQLRQRHLDDYQTLFSRVNLELNQDTAGLNTPELLNGYKSTNSSAQDRALEVLIFQYGRYLLISSSRAGSLPANLQGVWNKYQQAPWSADYHVNINLQMNYWLADLTNLSETLPPLFDFVDSLVAPGEQTAQRLFNAKGWTLLLNTNIWGFTGLIAWPTAFWQPEGAAWMARHYYEHYLFTLDKTFLAERAYPVMLGACQFWLDVLLQDEQQNWWVSPSYSPEHGNFTAGAAMSQQIVFDLLSNTLLAAGIVGDKANQQRIAAVVEKLDPGLRIGSWGQLQEWRSDLDDQESKHRHISQLYALHPAAQISPKNTPELAQAAKVTLNARGDEGTGWSKAWKVNFWARLHDGNRAHKLLGEQLLHSTLSNLWDNHPPFQIDGNFGATAGIAEMLLQSHLNMIELLPALPQAWPDGHISGLKARGAVTVDMSWQDSLLQQASFFSQQTQILQISIPGSDSKYTLNNSQGDVIPLVETQDGMQFSAQAGEIYTLHKLDRNKH
jgi:alpha-L-fucosidase 2